MGKRLVALRGVGVAAIAAASFCLSPTDPASALDGAEADGIGLEGFPSENEVVVDGIAAQVGSEIVLLSEVRRMAAPFEQQMRAAGVPETEILVMRADALERLIETKLVEEVVRRMQLSATESEVTAAITAIAQDNDLTLEQLTESIRSHGLTTEQYRAKIKSELERTKAINTFVRSRVHLDPLELSALYAERFGDQPTGGNELHLRHLLVTYGLSNMRSQETACAMVEDARQRIASGEASFTEIAAQLSDANRETGGDMGWIHARDMAPWMAPAIQGLAPGGITEPIPTGFGCNLLQVVERRQYQPVSFERASPQLEEELFRQKMEVEYINWMEKLRSEVYVERKGIYAEASRLREKAVAERNRKP
jgi:peptidyl-prolyl cis-trans isomerase SurA